MQEECYIRSICRRNAILGAYAGGMLYLYCIILPADNQHDYMGLQLKLLRC